MSEVERKSNVLYWLITNIGWPYMQGNLYPHQLKCYTNYRNINVVEVLYSCRKELNHVCDLKCNYLANLLCWAISSSCFHRATTAQSSKFEAFISLPFELFDESLSMLAFHYELYGFKALVIILLYLSQIHKYLCTLTGLPVSSLKFYSFLLNKRVQKGRLFFYIYLYIYDM